MSAAAGGGGGGGGGGGPRPYVNPLNTRTILSQVEETPLPQNVMNRIGSFLPENWWEDILRRELSWTYDRFMGQPLMTTPSMLEYGLVSKPGVLEAYIGYLKSKTFDKINGRYAAESRQRLLNELLKKTLHESSLEQFQTIVDAGAIADADVVGSILQMHFVDKLAYLLSKGLDPNMPLNRMNPNDIPLSRAISLLYHYNYFETVRLLLEAGATGAHIRTTFSVSKPPANANVYVKNRYVQDIQGILIILFLLLTKEDAISEEQYAALEGKISEEKMLAALKQLKKLILSGRIKMDRMMLNDKLVSLIVDSLGPEKGEQAIKALVGASGFRERRPALIGLSRAMAKGGKRRKTRRQRR